jgi:hypothetical protein
LLAHGDFEDGNTPASAASPVPSDQESQFGNDDRLQCEQASGYDPQPAPNANRPVVM